MGSVRCSRVAQYRAVETELNQPYFIALLADTYLKAQNFQFGMTLLDEAFDVMDGVSETWYESELFRLKGELLLAQSSDNQL